jgi:hypothetical protein
MAWKLAKCATQLPQSNEDKEQKMFAGKIILFE